MKTFVPSLVLVAFFSFGCAGRASAQNLSGVWVGSNGQESLYRHSGNRLETSGTGAPALPNLRGTASLTGGPRVYTGTWQNQMGEWRGSGTMTITVINENTTFVSARGFVYYRGNKTPWTGSGYNYRKAPLPNFAGHWRQAHHRGETIYMQRSGNAYVGNYRGSQHTLTVVGNTLRIQWTANGGGYATATRVTANRIDWSNGNVWTR